tara:strand:+ start:1301 stop:1768 length:468 start_codon:yes stop_codon:yes gene_type:complete
MKKLPIQLQRIIKKKRFSFTEESRHRAWRGGMKINYRITMVKAQDEDYYENISPLNASYNRININLKVTGMVEMRPNYHEEKRYVEIGKATKAHYNSWGGYDTKYDSLWGNQVNKKIRSEIRNLVTSQVSGFLKLLGITTEHWDSGIEVKKISWE